MHSGRNEVYRAMILTEVSQWFDRHRKRPYYTALGLDSIESLLLRTLRAIPRIAVSSRTARFLADKGIAAYYDPDLETVFLRNAPSRFTILELVHELYHAWVHQNGIAIPKVREERLAYHFAQHFLALVVAQAEVVDSHLGNIEESKRVWSELLANSEKHLKTMEKFTVRTKDGEVELGPLTREDRDFLKEHFEIDEPLEKLRGMKEWAALFR